MNSPTLSVDPVSELLHGRAVQVQGSGATSGQVSILQCAGTRTPEDLLVSCGPRSFTRLSAAADGTFNGDVVAQRWLGGPAEFIDCAVEACSLFVFVNNDATKFPPVTLAFIEGTEPPPRPRLSANPSSGLSDKQVVEVSGEGLPPGEVIDIAVCTPWDPASAEGPSCLHASGGAGTVDANGQLAIAEYHLPASEPAIGFDCTEPPGCELAWYQGVGVPPYVSTPISVVG